MVGMACPPTTVAVPKPKLLAGLVTGNNKPLGLGLSNGPVAGGVAGDPKNPDDDPWVDVATLWPTGPGDAPNCAVPRSAAVAFPAPTGTVADAEGMSMAT